MTKESLDANSLAMLVKRDIPFATIHGDRQVLHYEGGVYLPDGDDTIAADIERRMNGDKVTNYLINEVTGHIRRRTFVYRDDFDSDPNVINMANGLYDIKTGLHPHTPKHLSLHKSPIAYDQDATCPAIDKFIEEVVPDAYQQTIYEIGGYAMSPHKNLKRAFIFVGKKNSGKSVMIALLEHLIGGKAITHVSPLTVSNTTYGAAEYYGKQLNVVDDLGNTPIMDTGVLKSVIAGGRINAQFKYAQPFDYTPNVLCVFATNEVPAIKPFDDAYASRFSMIDFPNVFEGQNADPDMIEKLTAPEELSGFFNRCMTALNNVKDHRGFTNDATLADRVTAYRHKAHPVEMFIDEMCTIERQDARVMKDTLFRAYTIWSEDRQMRTEPMKELTIALQNRGCVIKQVYNDNDERKRAYIGVDFKNQLSDFAR
jgi:putative DNA primase/helicase